MPVSSLVNRIGDAVKATFTASSAVKVAFRDLRGDEKCETSMAFRASPIRTKCDLQLFRRTRVSHTDPVRLELSRALSQNTDPSGCSLSSPRGSAGVARVEVPAHAQASA